MFDSTPHISENHIFENHRAGIVTCGSSFPKIEKNQIFGNAQSGINIRDSSKCVVNKNIIYKNYYQVSTRASQKSDIEEIIKENEITGDNEFTNNCTIF